MKKIFFVALLFGGYLANAQSFKYFPMKSENNPGLDSFSISWYSEQLSAMGEPVFYNIKTPKMIFRFTWLRTFNHPVAIRIEKYKDTCVLFWKMCNGAGGYKPGKLIVNKQKNISKIQWAEFANYIKKINFWQMKIDKTVIGTDGSQWILEGRFGDAYNVVDVWTPRSPSDFYKCCNFLLGLTDLKIVGDEKY